MSRTAKSYCTLALRKSVKVIRTQIPRAWLRARKLPDCNCAAKLWRVRRCEDEMSFPLGSHVKANRYCSGYPLCKKESAAHLYYYSRFKPLYATSSVLYRHACVMRRGERMQRCEDGSGATWTECSRYRNSSRRLIFVHPYRSRLGSATQCGRGCKKQKWIQLLHLPTIIKTN